jgi:CheY-like chemotaxis protein
MNESAFVSYRFLNSQQSLSIIKQASNQHLTGCLQMFTVNQYWSLYLENGRLIYVCSSSGMFELIYRKLHHFSQEIAQVFKNIYQGVNESFGDNYHEKSLMHLDYWAICWLVSHKLISDVQAGIIIGEIALEIFPFLLQEEEGFYRFHDSTIFHQMPQFCHLDINFVISRAYNYSNSKSNMGLPVILEHTFQDLYEAGHTQVSNNHQNYVVKPIENVAKNQKLFSDDEYTHQQKSPHKLYKIACVDDSPTILSVIKSFLDEDFFTVELIDDSLKSLMQIIRSKPDLILLDISMPNLDGYQLCSWIRKHSDFKNTPVIMVTAKTGLINKAKARLMGATGYLTKPFTQEELLATLNKHLS